MYYDAILSLWIKKKPNAQYLEIVKIIFNSKYFKKKHHDFNTCVNKNLVGTKYFCLKPIDQPKISELLISLSLVTVLCTWSYRESPVTSQTNCFPILVGKIPQVNQKFHHQVIIIFTICQRLFCLNIKKDGT